MGWPPLPTENCTALPLIARLPMQTVYPLMGIAANVALVLAGSWVKWVNGTLTGGNTQAMLNYLVGGIVLLTGVMMCAKWALDT